MPLHPPTPDLDASQVARQQRETLEDAVALLLTVMPRLARQVFRKVHTLEGGDVLHDMGESQIRALFALSKGDTLTSDLARRFQVTNPTISRMIDAPVAKRYVERLRDSTDRRRIYLHLTDAGASVTGRMQESMRGALKDLLEPLTRQQLADIALACDHLLTLVPDFHEQREEHPPSH